MTSEETIKMLTAKVECMKRESSGIDQDCNYRNCDECKLCYEQGTVGEQREALQMAISALQELKNRNQELKNSNDPIRRQDAIRIVDGIDTWQAGWRGNAIESMKALPSAQPEKLTDKEQRIILSAMCRETRLCKEVDEKYPVEEKDTLEFVCKEILRKVKKALW